jgi:serine/threonine-protein kinase
MTDDVVDERVDVYALGVILHEMLTGEQPTGGKTPSEIVSRRLRTDPRPPSRLVPLAPAMNALVLRALARDPSRRFRRATALRDALLEITPPEPRTRTVKRAMKAPSIALPSPRIPRMSVRLPSFAPFAAAVAAMRSSVDERLADWLGRLAYAGRRSAAPLTAALALLAAVAGGALAVSARPDVAARPVVLATAIPAPAAAVLASTSSPVPIRSPETTAVPAAVPIAEPSIEATSAPTPAAVAVTAGGDPAGTIVTFYRFITGHDYASASGLWSDRMQAAYPPQTNIWGRFDRTTSIVARSASLTSASAGSAAVAVDLIETMRDGTTRHWVGSWYLVRSGAGWLLDSPGLRPA